MSSSAIAAIRSLRNFRLGNRAGKSGAPLVAFKAAELALRTLRDYHQHEIIGLENIPKTGPVLMICNHSFATYDGVLPVVAIFDERDRLMWGVADRLIFRTPGLGDFFRGVGFSEGTRDELVARLSEGEGIGLAPGGMREALRIGREKYRVDWKGRTGFVRVSILSGAPIVLAACPRGDDIYSVYDSPLTSWAYAKHKIPVAPVRGLGPTLIPRPVKLTHVMSEPIFPPPGGERVSEEALAAHHAYVEDRMNALMQEALRAEQPGWSRPPPPPPPHKLAPLAVDDVPVDHPERHASRAVDPLAVAPE